MRDDIARLLQVVELEQRNAADNIAAAFEGVVKDRVEAELGPLVELQVNRRMLNMQTGTLKPDAAQFEAQAHERRQQYEAGYTDGAAEALRDVEELLRAEGHEYDLLIWWRSKQRKEAAEQQRKAERKERAK